MLRPADVTMIRMWALVVVVISAGCNLVYPLNAPKLADGGAGEDADRPADATMGSESIISSAFCTSQTIQFCADFDQKGLGQFMEDLLGGNLDEEAGTGYLGTKGLHGTSNGTGHAIAKTASPSNYAGEIELRALTSTATSSSDCDPTIVRLRWSDTQNFIEVSADTNTFAYTVGGGCTPMMKTFPGEDPSADHHITFTIDTAMSAVTVGIGSQSDVVHCDTNSSQFGAGAIDVSVGILASKSTAPCDVVIDNVVIH
jgi:hypothetical protein